MQEIPVLCVVGPTASGKTALSLCLAKALGGEIVNMDSLQIYRRMDIGTAKPSLEERQGVPHHLLDIVEPTQPFSVAQYAEAAEAVLRDIYGRGRLPILTGGTGFYLRALTDGLSLGGVRSDPALRESLRREAAEPDGKRKLHDRLRAVDPDSAARLHENDVLRVTRALEVYALTGAPIIRQEREAETSRPYRFVMLGTTLAREALYARCNERAEAMLARGLLDEVRSLLDSGVPPDAQAMQGIGYKELSPVLLQGEPLPEAVTRMKQNTRHYAKRQWTWFRAEPRVQWLDMNREESTREALRIGEAFWREAQA